MTSKNNQKIRTINKNFSAEEKRKKVLHYISTFDCGGIETYFNGIYNNIGEKYSIYLLVENPIEKDIRDKLHDNGINILQIPNMTKHGFFAHAKAIRKIFKENNFDIVHVHDSNIRFLVMLQAKIHSVKNRIYHIHSGDIGGSQLNRIIKKIGIKINVICSNKRLTCSEEAAKKKKISDCKLINNGIDIDSFSYNKEERQKTRAKLNIPKNNKVILFIGRIEKVKNLNFLIEIMANLEKNKSTKYTLLIVGDGDELNQIKEEAKALIDTQAIFVGKQKELAKYYSAGDIFCLPSLSEGLPMVLLEAQANGLPIVATSNMTKKAKINNNFKFLNLNSGAAYWAEIINNTSVEHISPAKKISEYSTKETAKKLVRIYEKYQ